jgi:hypothetical protein
MIQQNYQLFDIIGVGLIITLAVLWLMRIVIKMRNNKCATVCSGCSANKCSTKSFATKVSKNIANPSLNNPLPKVIKIHCKS